MLLPLITMLTILVVLTARCDMTGYWLLVFRRAPVYCGTVWYDRLLVNTVPQSSGVLRYSVACQATGKYCSAELPCIAVQCDMTGYW